MLYLVKQMIFLANCMAISGVISIPSLLDSPITTWAWGGAHDNKSIVRKNSPNKHTQSTSHTAPGVEALVWRISFVCKLLSPVELVGN